MTANGEVQTGGEAAVYVKQLDFFVKVMLCEDHGYTYHWTSGQKPHLIRNGKKIDCKKNQQCTVCGSWIISEFFLAYIFIYTFTIFFTGVNIGEQRKCYVMWLTLRPGPNK